MNGVLLTETDAALLNCADTCDGQFSIRSAVNMVANSACLTEFVYLIGSKFATMFQQSLAIASSCQYQ
jgi:hypothetical protein